MEKSVLDKIIDLLKENNIEYKMTEHEPVRTSIDAARVRGVELKTGAKAMIVRSKGKYYLLVLPADKQIDWRGAKSMLNVKDLSLASEEEAEKVAKVKMGSVPPLGNILGLDCYYDKGILDVEYVNFNPGSLSHTISMKSSDLVKIVEPILITTFTK